MIANNPPATLYDSDAGTSGGLRDWVAGLEKGLAIIECFSRDRPRLTIADVSRLTGLSRAAARRYLLTLTHLGYAHHDGKFFRLAPRVLRLGHAFLASAPLPALLQPHLEQLSDRLHESCSASVLDGDAIVYVARSAAKRIMAVGLAVGTRLPAFCTAMGRVLLAALDPPAAAALLAAAPRPAFTPLTQTDPAALMEVLDRTRRQGYCIVDQELEAQLVSIAVPIRDAGGRVVCAVNISAPAVRMPADAMPAHFLPPLLDLAAQVSRALQ